MHNRIPSEKLPIGGTMGKVGVNDRNTQYEIVMIQSPSSTTKDDDDEHMYENQELVGRPLKAAELASYIEEMSGRKDAFKEEFVVSSSLISVISQHSIQMGNSHVIVIIK